MDDRAGGGGEVICRMAEAGIRNRLGPLVFSSYYMFCVSLLAARPKDTQTIKRWPF